MMFLTISTKMFHPLTKSISQETDLVVILILATPLTLMSRINSMSPTRHDLNSMSLHRLQKDSVFLLRKYFNVCRVRTGTTGVQYTLETIL